MTGIMFRCLHPQETWKQLRTPAVCLRQSHKTWSKRDNLDDHSYVNLENCGQHFMLILWATSSLMIVDMQDVDMRDIFEESGNETFHIKGL